MLEVMNSTQKTSETYPESMTSDEMICNMKEIRVFSDKPTVGLLKFAESTGLVIYAKVNRDGNTRYEKGYTIVNSRSLYVGVKAE